MKLMKFFSQPILLAIVWLLNIRPATFIVDHYFNSSNISFTTKSTMDVALLASIVALLASLWKPPIKISTRLVNCETNREHSTFTDNDNAVNQRVLLEVNIEVRAGKIVNWNRVLQFLGGIYLCLRENSLVAHQFDSKKSSSLIVNGTKIHLFKGAFEVSQPVELVYIVLFRRTMEEVRTIELTTSVQSIRKIWFTRVIYNFLLSPLLKVDDGKHPVYFNDKR
ncbi:hypothetical protein [Paenibacillus polymyxa]|uniref:hypothetical protein n=1 Tax=Paenibacillus polymyxa TaxID=1406 RepID=UPI002349A111|nr:hypothetical protein [Paenibacillus polymyxa]WCM61386.1 hypothetical protein OYT09_26230 [Paenibacillus polymyxa]